MAVGESINQLSEANKWKDTYESLVLALKRHDYKGCECQVFTIGAMKQVQDHIASNPLGKKPATKAV